jgi:hypothetical protein
VAKVRIEVLDAVIDGKKKGEQLEVEEKDAKHLIAIGYAKEVKVEAPKVDEKAPTKTTRKSK